jgi:cell wall-associated NlpC family hydrolase
MSRRHRAQIVAVAVAAGLLAAAAPAAAGGATADRPTTAGAVAATTAYLEARAAAVTAPRPASVLARWVTPGSELALGETRLARGTAVRGRRSGRTARSAGCEVTVLRSTPAEDGRSVVVTARAVTSITWRSGSGASDVETSGIDHTVTLARSRGRWIVVADAYTDVLTPACLEAAGAPLAAIRASARALERTVEPLRLPSVAVHRASIPARRYSTIIAYDRAAAQAYADRYALSYNSTYVRFAGADCANFASQCALAGDMPMAGSTAGSGWWYDKDGSSSPADDTYSLSWINVTRQMSYWNTRRTDWETSAGALSRGDFIFYDWSGDGVWDHVAVVAGTNSNGQRVIDAHTTDHYRVYWKLGSSSTKYRYARVRAQWVIV